MADERKTGSTTNPAGDSDGGESVRMLDDPFIITEDGRRLPLREGDTTVTVRRREGADLRLPPDAIGSYTIHPQDATDDDGAAPAAASSETADGDGASASDRLLDAEAPLRADAPSAADRPLGSDVPLGADVPLGGTTRDADRRAAHPPTPEMHPAPEPDGAVRVADAAVPAEDEAREADVDAGPTAAIAPAPAAEPGPPAEVEPPAEVTADADDGEEDDDPDRVRLDRGEAARVSIRSEEIDEILTEMPGGLLRWGTSAIFVTVIAGLLIAWWISYPDVISGRLVLSSPSPPVRIVSPEAGRVERVFVTDGTAVEAGTPLVLLEDAARYADVRELDEMLERIEPAVFGAGALPAPPATRLALGDVQSAYAAFVRALSDHRTLDDDAFYERKAQALRDQIGSLVRLRGQLEEQQDVLNGQLEIAREARDRSRTLAEREMIPQAEADRGEEEFLQRRYAAENGRAALTNNEIQVAAQRAALLDLEQGRTEQVRRARTELQNAFRTLRTAITRWEEENLVRASVAGTVSFFRELHENQFVGGAEPLVAVVPDDGRMVGRVTLSGTGAGKVRPGQRVMIQFDNFPYREYGTVEGEVQSVARLGFDLGDRGGLGYRATVTLPDGLVTNYGRELEFQPEMQANAQIVTEEMRLLERIFNQLRSLDDAG